MTYPGIRIGVASLMLAASFNPSTERQHETAFGDEPWVFVQHESIASALPGTRFRGQLAGQVRVRLDDGSLASVRIEQKPCSIQDRCDPSEGGCFTIDSHWMSLIDAAGRSIARVNICAAYAELDIVPLDLVDGPGEELLLVRPLGRSAPPNGHEVKILKIGRSGSLELLPSLQVAGNLSSAPFACGKWRSQLLIDADQAKPRSIVVTSRTMLQDECRLDEPAQAAAIRREKKTLRFSSGRYAITSR